MIGAMKKKMMVLPSKFAIEFNAIYAMNISAESATTTEIFPQMTIFL